MVGTLQPSAKDTADSIGHIEIAGVSRLSRLSMQAQPAKFGTKTVAFVDWTKWPKNIPRYCPFKMGRMRSYTVGIRVRFPAPKSEHADPRIIYYDLTGKIIQASSGPNPGLPASRKFPPFKTMVHVPPARLRNSE
jgi:hypothetical protein